MAFLLLILKISKEFGVASNSSKELGPKCAGLLRAPVCWIRKVTAVHARSSTSSREVKRWCGDYHFPICYSTYPWGCFGLGGADVALLGTDGWNDFSTSGS